MLLAQCLKDIGDIVPSRLTDWPLSAWNIASGAFHTTTGDSERWYARAVIGTIDLDGSVPRKHAIHGSIVAFHHGWGICGVPPLV